MDISLRDPCLVLHQRGKEFENTMKSQTLVTSTNMQNTENVYYSEEFEGGFFCKEILSICDNVLMSFHVRSI